MANEFEKRSSKCSISSPIIIGVIYPKHYTDSNLPLMGIVNEDGYQQL